MDTSLKPDALYFKKQIYILLLLSIFFYIFFIPFCLIILSENGPALFILFLGTVGWAVLCAIILFFIKLWINNLSYIIKDTSITIYQGIFTKVEQNIPDRKVTDFILRRGLLDRFLGIGSIKIQTAGGSGEMGYEGILSGILDYEEVHKNLRDKLVNIQTPSSAPIQQTENANDLVLNEILAELKDINKKIN